MINRAYVKASGLSRFHRDHPGGYRSGSLLRDADGTRDVRDQRGAVRSDHDLVHACPAADRAADGTDVQKPQVFGLEIYRFDSGDHGLRLRAVVCYRGLRI